MPAGRKPEPTHLRLLKGDERPSRSRTQGPKPPPIIPTPPDFLSADARAEWDRVVPELDRLGLVTMLDRAGLAAYCEAWSRFVMATAVLHEEPLIIKKAGRSVKNPALQVAKDAAADMLRWCVDFGMTPSARGRMAVPGTPDGAPSLDDLLR